MVVYEMGKSCDFRWSQLMIELFREKNLPGVFLVPGSRRYMSVSEHNIPALLSQTSCISLIAIASVCLLISSTTPYTSIHEYHSSSTLIKGGPYGPYCSR